MNREDYLKKYNRMVYEYTMPVSTLDEDDPNVAPVADPNVATTPAVDPNSMAGAPMADPNAMPMDANAMSAAPMAGPNAMPAQTTQEAPGFEPAPAQGEESQDNSMDMGAEQQATENVSGEIDDLKKETQDKIDELSGKFENLLGQINGVIEKIDSTDSKIDQLSAELVKRNPTPEQKLTMRSLQGKPFDESPDSYWKEKEEISNYSPEDDKNGEDSEEYKITQSDIDSVRDWRGIAKSFDDERMGLKDIFGY